MKFSKTVATAAVLTAAGTSAHADELKLAHFASTNYHLHNSVFVPLAEAFGEATGGDVTMRVYPGGELGRGPAQQYNRVIDGIADLAYGLPGYTAAQFPLTLLAELPGVMPADLNRTAEIWEDIEHLDREFRRVHLLGLWTAQEAVLLTADVPVRSIEDLEGLSIRVPSANTGLVVEAWGATAVSMPITDVYTSMETGTIDGVLVDASVLHSFRLGEVTSYVTRGMNSTNSMFMLVMNRDSWEDLSEEHQAMLTDLTGAEMSEVGRVTMDDAATEALEAWIAEGGELIELSAEAAAPFNAATDALAAATIAELEAEGVAAEAFATALRD